MKFDEAISFENLNKSYDQCLKGKLWKDSVIAFDANSTDRLIDAERRLRDGSYRFSPFYETTIYERGKSRLIRSQCIQDRIIHKAVNEHIIKPTFEKSYIYDNAASQKGKGADFALKRLKCHLNRAYRKWGNDFYVLQLDIRHYFDSIPHAYIKELFEQIQDPKAKDFCCSILDSYGEVGMGLGSEICQSIALLALNEMDHLIKEKLRVKEYGRYMDDAYLIHRDKEFLKECLEMIRLHLQTIGLALHSKKTQIFPIKNGIKYLGFRHNLTASGHVSVKAKRETICRARRKMRKIKKKIDAGELTWLDAYRHFMSVKGHLERGNCYYQVKALCDYYDSLFIWRRS